jgi:3-hydroxymyristoyl/3-hydroxydecanoyl-(acyl carrier protein) dehydratase
MSQVHFEFRVPHDHPSLAGHFPGRPVVPGVVLLDHVLGALAAHGSAPIRDLQQVKFLATLLPGETARGCWDLTGASGTFHVWTRRGDDEVNIARGVGWCSHFREVAR